MIPHEGILRFMDAQKRLLRQTYDEAWQRGVESYAPDENPQKDPTLPQTMAVSGLTGAALLAARRRYKYSPPVHPNPVRRAVALAPAFAGVNSMGEDLTSLANEATAGIAESNDALANWAASNGWRLAAGAAVAWAGEQAGFAEAANTDGQYLYAWTSAGDDRVCADCEQLSTFPPMPLDQWPTSPGSGDTQCSYGCRCDWDTWPMDQGLPTSTLSSPQQDLLDQMAISQADALNSMLPDAAYLD